VCCGFCKNHPRFTWRQPRRRLARRRQGPVVRGQIAGGGNVVGVVFSNRCWTQIPCGHTRNQVFAHAGDLCMATAKRAPRGGERSWNSAPGCRRGGGSARRRVPDFLHHPTWSLSSTWAHSRASRRREGDAPDAAGQSPRWATTAEEHDGGEKNIAESRGPGSRRTPISCTVEESSEWRKRDTRQSGTHQRDPAYEEDNAKGSLDSFFFLCLILARNNPKNIAIFMVYMLDHFYQSTT